MVHYASDSVPYSLEWQATYEPQSLVCLYTVSRLLPTAFCIVYLQSFGSQPTVFSAPTVFSSTVSLLTLWSQFSSMYRIRSHPDIPYHTPPWSLSSILISSILPYPFLQKKHIRLSDHGRQTSSAPRDAPVSPYHRPSPASPHSTLFLYPTISYSCYLCNLQWQLIRGHWLDFPSKTCTQHRLGCSLPNFPWRRRLFEWLVRSISGGTRTSVCIYEVGFRLGPGFG